MRRARGGNMRLRSTAVSAAAVLAALCGGALAFPLPHPPAKFGDVVAPLRAECATSTLSGHMVGAHCYYAPAGGQWSWSAAWDRCAQDGGALARLVGQDVLQEVARALGAGRELRVAFKVAASSDGSAPTKGDVYWVSSAGQSATDGVRQPDDGAVFHLGTVTAARGVFNTTSAQFHTRPAGNSVAILCEKEAPGGRYTLIHEDQSIPSESLAPISTLPHGDPRQCAHQCFIRPRCLSFTVAADSKVCKLYDVKVTEVGDLVFGDEDGTNVYVERF